MLPELVEHSVRQSSSDKMHSLFPKVHNHKYRIYCAITVHALIIAHTLF